MSVFVESRLLQFGILEDEGLDVLAFDGKADMTVSTHAALAARAGKRWGCVLCAVLSVLVQHDHCEKTLTDAPLSTFDCLRAFFWITCVLAIPVTLIWCLF